MRTFGGIVALLISFAIGLAGLVGMVISRGFWELVFFLGMMASGLCSFGFVFQRLQRKF